MVDIWPSPWIARRLEHMAAQVHERASQDGNLSERRLREEIALQKGRMRRAEHLGKGTGRGTLIESLALLAAASERELGVMPSQRQIVASLAMYEGYVIDIDPTDRRSLATALVAILHSFSGHPCHVVIGNEFLGRRDASIHQPLYAICGCSVAALAHDTPADQISKCYGADILYATGRQLVSDFIRDRLVLSGASGKLRRRLWELRTPNDAQRPVTSGTFVAIIDDVGSSLMDEATSPVVISAPGRSSILEEVTQAALALVDQFQVDRDYYLRFEPNLVLHFSVEGQQRMVDCARHLPPFWRDEQRCEDAICAAILARDVFRKERHYLVQQQRIVILDENIHRLMSGQAWHFGVIQAIEAREDLSLTVPPRTIARAAFQEFFPRYAKLCGAGNLLTEFRKELYGAYGLKLLRLPARPRGKLERISRYEFVNRKEKRDALIDAAIQFHQSRFPVLIFTRRILDTIEIAAQLVQFGVECNVLEGKDQESDARMLADARHPGRVTVVTGNAGRGTEIALEEAISTATGLQIMLFEHNDTSRADNLIATLAGQHGVTDRLNVFASLDDELFSKGPGLLTRPLHFFARYARLRKLCVTGLVYLCQRTARRQAEFHRRVLMLREEQLDQQLSFFGRINQDSGPRF